MASKPDCANPGFGPHEQLCCAPGGPRVAPSIVQGIEPFQMMVNAKEMPTVEFADYTFVFAH